MNSTTLGKGHKEQTERRFRAAYWDTWGEISTDKSKEKLLDLLWKAEPSAKFLTRSNTE